MLGPRIVLLSLFFICGRLLHDCQPAYRAHLITHDLRLQVLHTPRAKRYRTGFQMGCDFQKQPRSVRCKMHAGSRAQQEEGAQKSALPVAGAQR